jgi:hypothetical protein
VISFDEKRETMEKFMSKEYAKMLVDYFASVEAGGEDGWLKLSATEKEERGITVFVGKVTVKEWLEKNKAAFE